MPGAGRGLLLTTVEREGPVSPGGRVGSGPTAPPRRLRSEHDPPIIALVGLLCRLGPHIPSPRNVKSLAFGSSANRWRDAGFEPGPRRPASPGSLRGARRRWRAERCPASPSPRGLLTAWERLVVADIPPTHTRFNSADRGPENGGESDRARGYPGNSDQASVPTGWFSVYGTWAALHPDGSPGGLFTGRRFPSFSLSRCTFTFMYPSEQLLIYQMLLFLL